MRKIQFRFDGFIGMVVPFIVTTIIFLFTSVFSSFAEPLCDYKSFSLNEGFFQSKVSKVIQDKKGLIWISTRNGLSQFDGYRFRNYKSYPGDGSPLVNYRLNSIYENAAGDIWCQNLNRRVYLFDIGSKKFIDVLKSTETKYKKHYETDKIYPLKKGVTWVTCRDGSYFRIDDALCKNGDGVTLDKGSKKIRRNTIYEIKEDTQGDEWILTDKGVTIIGKKKFVNPTPFHDFHETKQSIWLVCPDNTIAQYNPRTEKLLFVKLPSDINRIYLSDTLRNGSLALGTNAGLLILNTQTLKYLRIRVKVSPTASERVESVFEDHLGDLWMSNEKEGILHYRKEDGKVTLLQSPKNEYLKHNKPSLFLVMEDNQGNVWTTPRGGNLCYFDRKEQKLKYYYSNPNNPNTIISPSTRTRFIDRQGNLWIGANYTFGKISFYKKGYTLIPKEQDELEVRAFLLDKNKNLWVSSLNNKVKILDADNRCLGYLSANGTLSSTPCSFDANVYAFMEDHQGNIWLGTKKKGIYLLERKDDNQYSFKIRHFEHDRNDKYSLSDNKVYSLYQDTRQRIWVGTSCRGLNLIEKDKTGNIRFINCFNRLKHFPMPLGKQVRSIMSIDDKVILVGTMDGIISFSSDFKSPEQIRFFTNSQKKDILTSLSNNNVMYMYRDSRKRIYALTETGGVNRFTSDNLLSDNILFQNYIQREALISDQTLSMIEDRTGGLWLVTKQALYKFNPLKNKKNHFFNYTFNQDFVFSESAIALNAKGNVVVGTDKGILEINPEEQKGNIFVPSIIFSDLKIQGKTAPEAIQNQTKLVLDPSQRDITIEFAALDYQDSKKIEYAYMMEGLEKEWHYVNQDRYATYMNLPNGKYHFLVKSTNSEGVWVDNMQRLSIEVQPTFWETGWAWLLIILLVAGIIMVVVYILFTIYRLKHEVNMEHQLSNVKLNFFTDISHELRTPLTLISSPVADILEHEPLSAMAKEHLTIVQKNTDRMLRLVNQILDFRKIQHKKMRVLIEETEIVSFVSRIMDNFQLVAEDKNISFQLDSAHKPLILWIDKDKFEKIIFNLLSNAFKYTPEYKSVTVRISPQDDKVSISVIDEGVGILTQKIDSLFQRFETLVNQNVLNASSGIGLSLVKELVDLHHGSIEVESQLGVGSKFKVVFLTGKDHFRDDEVDYLLSDDIGQDTSKTDTGSLLCHDECGHSDTEVSEDKWTILVVEDNAELRRFMYNVLSHEYNVVEAVNGKDGFEKTMSIMPDMIVSDVMMPVMDGLDMVKAVKEHKDLCHIPIILLSAKSMLDDRIKGFENGIDDYITKPFSTNYLKARIRNLITQRHKLQELYLSSLTTGSKKPDIEDHDSTLNTLISASDKMFIQTLMEYMEENLGNSDINVEDLSNLFSMSRSAFFKKTKMLLGVSPNDFIRDLRIKRATLLIESDTLSLAEVAYKCGFSDPNYFGKCFKKFTGYSPSEYKKKGIQIQ